MSARRALPATNRRAGLKQILPVHDSAANKTLTGQCANSSLSHVTAACGLDGTFWSHSLLGEKWVCGREQRNEIIL